MMRQILPRHFSWDDRKVLAWILAYTLWAVFLAPSSLWAGPKPMGDEFWKSHDSLSRTLIDHAPWQSFLSRHLDTTAEDVNRVRYGKVPAEDRQALEAYLTDLQAVQVSRLSRNEQKAFWINLYNAMTVALVLRHYPVKSIRDIQLAQTPLKKGPWDAEVLQVEGRKLSLNTIEHRILRPLWKDPLVHFGLNCASVGCPALLPMAFTAENTERLLRKETGRFINSSRGAAFEKDGLYLSSIFDWYRSDFGENEKQVLDFLTRFAAPPLKSRLAGYTGKIRYRYDWSLNEAPAR